MNKKAQKDSIQTFRKMAEAMGKDLRIEKTRHGIRLVFDGRSVKLPSNSPGIRYPSCLARKLGLSSYNCP